MSDNITLPREVVQDALDALTGADDFSPSGTPIYMQEITALRTALAAPRLEVTVDPRLTAEEAVAISAALAAEQPKHPGYVIGSHWLETAYSRICAGEAEADVLRDCGWERVDDAEALRRDAERYRWLRDWKGGTHDIVPMTGRYFGTPILREELDAAIDAAMEEDKT